MYSFAFFVIICVRAYQLLKEWINFRLNEYSFYILSLETHKLLLVLWYRTFIGIWVSDKQGLRPEAFTVNHLSAHSSLVVAHLKWVPLKWYLVENECFNCSVNSSSTWYPVSIIKCLIEFSSSSRRLQQ